MKGKAIELLLALLFKNNPHLAPADMLSLKKHYGPTTVDHALIQARCCPFLVTLRNRFGEHAIERSLQKAPAELKTNLLSEPNPAIVNKRGTLQFTYCAYAMAMEQYLDTFDTVEAALGSMAQIANTNPGRFCGPHLFFVTLNSIKRTGCLLNHSCRLYRTTLHELAEPFYDPDNLEGQVQEWAVRHIQSCQQKIGTLFKIYPGMCAFLEKERPDWLGPLDELIQALNKPYAHRPLPTPLAQ